MPLTTPLPPLYASPGYGDATMLFERPDRRSTSWLMTSFHLCEEGEVVTYSPGHSYRVTWTAVRQARGVR
jgi:hypothetical protein